MSDGKLLVGVSRPLVGRGRLNPGDPLELWMGDALEVSPLFKLVVLS